MKTKLFFFVFLFFAGFNLSAGVISLEQAQKVARNFYYEKYMQYEGTILYDQITIRSVQTEKEGSYELYYIFHMNPEGFVIVSAEDRLNPVIGYSFLHPFVTENQPPNIKWWMMQYAEQVKYVREKKVEPDKKKIEKWAFYLEEDFELNPINKGSKEVEPLMTTLWDQGWPYNYYCPETPSGGSGGHTWAGCVATAAAQIGYYWRWPDHGRGYTSYIPPSHPEYGIQYADFENTWYRYDEMCDAPETVNLAIAEYIYQSAVGMHMDFDPDGSIPASADSIEYYFRLFPFAWYDRDTMSVDNWKEILTNSLDNRFPVYYSGYPSSGVGHAFVCDGYQDEDLFHFNLGWGGTSNGYYTIDNVFGFNYHQQMMPNFHPDTLQFVYPPYCSGTDTCKGYEGSVSDGSGPVKDYLNNTQASWLIDPQTEFDSIVSIILMVKQLDLFNDGDRLFIYDGEDNSAPLLAELSGNTIPGNIESTGNKVFIEFITDGANTGGGFYLNYKTTRPVWCSGMTNLTQPSATFNDGSGSFYYYNLTNCTWMINPGHGGPLTMNFNYFNTEENHDFLKIYDGETMQLLAQLSGHYEIPPDPVTAQSGKLFVAFLTNNNTNSDGWEAWYSISTGIQNEQGNTQLRIIPNPAGPEVRFIISLATAQMISIEVFDMVGNLQAHMATEYLKAGNHTISGNLEGLAAGVYFCVMQAGDERISRKLIKVE